MRRRRATRDFSHLASVGAFEMPAPFNPGMPSPRVQAEWRRAFAGAGLRDPRSNSYTQRGWTRAMVGPASRFEA